MYDIFWHHFWSLVRVGSRRRPTAPSRLLYYPLTHPLLRLLVYLITRFSTKEKVGGRDPFAVSVGVVFLIVIPVLLPSYLIKLTTHTVCCHHASTSNTALYRAMHYHIEAQLEPQQNNREQPGTRSPAVPTSQMGGVYDVVEISMISHFACCHTGRVDIAAAISYTG